MTKERIYTILLKNVSLGYEDNIICADANVGFGWGEFTALIGRNGAGKSTLLRSMAALHKPLSGQILINNKPLTEIKQLEVAEMLSFVSTEEVKTVNLQVKDVVALGRAPFTNWVGNLTQEDRSIIDSSLHLVGMESYANKSMSRLSDGERQRVMIARALAQQTPIILLDEPTAFLDLPNRYEISLLLRDLAHKQGKSIIFSTHDMNIALELADTIVLLDKGEFHYGTANQLIDQGVIDNMLKNSSVRFNREKWKVEILEKICK